MLRRRQIQFIHVTSRDVWVKTEYHRLRVPAAVLPYAFNMSELYTLADLVVCRAGGGTIAELAYYGRPAIIIPHPRTKQDHQVLNALLVQERNAGIVIPSNKLSPGILANALLRYLENEPLAKQRGKQIQLLGKRNAARLIVKEINKLPAVSLQESDNSNPS
jgi:UDP-N-acetylglucosamine--N-acetylmuramyl-(pentapeptide) pyrophosphoryl-undecaprenol N-acetylglucosamine transferase